MPIVSGRKHKHGSTCGHPGTVTELSWQYLGTTDQGDKYEFVRTFPAGDPNRTTTKKEVIFAGKELLLFDDEDSTVLLRAAASEEQSVEPERPVRQ
ncbi:MAG: hypothetical protein SGJ19_01100 [Planctomycetia bacterium]|nr:hypothetical protein [Planctomycetia bacterium]